MEKRRERSTSSETRSGSAQFPLGAVGARPSGTSLVGSHTPLHDGACSRRYYGLAFDLLPRPRSDPDRGRRAEDALYPAPRHQRGAHPGPQITSPAVVRRRSRPRHPLHRQVGPGMSATATQIATLGYLMSQASSPQVPGEGLRAAEDRGFEPRRVVTPNRISSVLPAVPRARRHPRNDGRAGQA